MSTAKEVKECYISTLADLTFNSKTLINVLTILAEENIAHAPVIVEAIESHLIKGDVDCKLPALYLIDCIIKNIGGTYKTLLCQNIVSVFCHVFQLVNEKTRGEMFKLRQTWNDELPKAKLCELDVSVKQLDPAWPIVIPQSTNNIHLNPKFLQNSALPKKSPPLPQSRMPSLPATNQEFDALDMQKKIIIKQKQLLELERKKLELELLQQQVKLQEQMKSSSLVNSQTVPVSIDDGMKATGKGSNILLKPEVAKQLSGAAQGVAKTKASNATGILTQRHQNTTSSTNATPRIAPVNSALVAAAASRPIRDPRLLRQHGGNSNASIASVPTVNTNVLLDSKSSNATTAETLSNKIFTSKVSVREHRSTEPRLVASKDSSAQINAQNSSNNVTTSNSNNKSNKSNLTQSPSKRSSSKQSPNASPAKGGGSKSRSGAPKSTSTCSGSSSGSKGSSSSLDSPTKSIKVAAGNKVGRAPTTPSSKHKKKEASAVGGSSLSLRAQKKKEKPSSTSKRDRETASGNKSAPIKRDNSPGVATSSFKEMRGRKTRNYRVPSPSPEPVGMDVDLRNASAPQEKQPRIQTIDITDDKDLIGELDVIGMDVDLRQLPGMINKKRSSTESAESVAPKKTRMEVFDELFGNEDTDLRRLPAVMGSPKLQERPPTPPPPIISTKTKIDHIDLSQETKKSSDLDLVREKLANATRNSNNMGVSKYNMTADQRKLIARHKQHPSSQEDVDLRNNLDDSFSKIIISSADEQCIKTGNMTKEQETALMNKILAQIENQKLKEAKRSEENIGDVALQAISDEELEPDFSGSSEEEQTQPNYPPNIFYDKDERLAPPAPHLNADPFGNFPRNQMELRSRGMMWRGRPRRGMMMPRGAMRMMRPPVPVAPESWIRPNGPWRPMVSNFGKPYFDQNAMDIDGANSVDPLDQPQMQQDTPEITIVDCANQDNVKSIVIDNESRDIRYYDDTAVVFMSAGDPREISFQNGSRKVFFGDQDVAILSFNEPYKDVLVNGHLHRVKFGGPSRELHIDDRWYECFIGGPGIRIELDGEFVLVKVEGPPPQVKIGQVKRTDLVAGKITMIIDGKTVVPVFLDGKPQNFDINGQTHTLRFVNSLQTALIDDTPLDIKFGGLPKSLLVGKRKYYVRFSVLPRGVTPGKVNIHGMESLTLSVDQNEPALPVFQKKARLKAASESPERNSNSPLSIQNLLQQQNLSNNLETLSSLMASSLMPSQVSNNLNSSGYQVENDAVGGEISALNLPEEPSVASDLPAANILPPSLNINDLFQKLVASGIVTTAQDNQPALITPPSSLVPSISRAPHVVHKPNFKPVNFGKPETLKIRQPVLISTLYSGMQCSSCGMRFPPEHSMHYSQHLDWHFRQNRKGKKNIRKASSRRWYYSLSDWKNYEEIEDLEEREKSYFENQQQAQAEGAPDEAEEETEIPSVPADPTVQDARCDVCQDRFDQFYNEEKEEWHLRMAIRVDGKDYHPVCYEDYQASLMDSTYEEVSKDEKPDDNVIPGLEVAKEELPKEHEEKAEETAEIVIEDDDVEDAQPMQCDDEETIQSAFAEVSPKNEEEEEDGDDDDVIINEVVPEKIDLVDDDKYEDMPAREAPENVVVKVEPVDDGLDGFVDVEGGVIKTTSINDIKIKDEPIDPDDELQITGEDRLEGRGAKTEAPHTDLLAFIDGNVEFDTSTAVTHAGGIGGKIKINITKPLPVIAPKECNNKELSSEKEKAAESIDPSQPLPPGEEPIQLNLKPALQGVKLKRLPPAKKGTELTGLCSIM